MLNYKLPFYGKYGSVKEIIERNGFYYVSVYCDINNCYKNSMYPVNDSTKEMLEKIFYNNLGEYLKFSRKKFDSYVNDTRVKENNYRMNLLYLLSFASICGIALPVVGIVFNSVIPFLLGCFTIAASIPILAACIVTHKEYRFYKKADKFIKEYQKGEYFLDKYQKLETLQKEKENVSENIKINEVVKYSVEPIIEKENVKKRIRIKK